MKRCPSSSMSADSVPSGQLRITQGCCPLGNFQSSLRDFSV